MQKQKVATQAYAVARNDSGTAADDVGSAVGCEPGARCAGATSGQGGRVRYLALRDDLLPSLSELTQASRPRACSRLTSMRA